MHSEGLLLTGSINRRASQNILAATPLLCHLNLHFMKYFLFILGCQQNYADAEKISAILHSLGYAESSEKDSDLIIIIACSVRQKAVDRIWGKISKDKKKTKKYILCGCVLEADKKKLSPKIDLVLDSKNICDLPQYLKEINLPSEQLFEVERNPKNKIGYVSIGVGCNNFCSYCAVPHTRGREIYFNPDDIINETKHLVTKGCEEIMLLAQNVNSYKSIDEKGMEVNFVDLLKKINSIEENFNISFLSPHPKDTSDELIDAIANLKKIKKEIHLPLQSGDDEILKKMNRHYTSEHFLNLIQKLRTKISNIHISTDIIVGFPSETDEQFSNTLNVCKIAEFNKVYVSQYSPRKGTTSEKLFIDDISRETKKTRWEAINNLINKQK